jgi:hypothetical protein
MANFLKSLFVKGVEIDPAGAASDQVLKYNGTKFVPGTASTVGSIDDLSDVIVTTPSNGQALVYNGTDWVNGASGVAGSTYTATIGDGTNDVFVLSHGLNTRDVFVTIRNAASPYEVIDAYWAATTTGTVTIDFSVIPTTNSVRVAIYAAVTGNNTALALDTLTDVVVTSPLQFQGLMYDGTNWVNSNIPNVYLVRNNTGSTILKGTLVGAVGAEPSGRIDVAPFQVTGTENSELRAMGIATSNISSGVNGEVMSFGTLTGLDTRGSTASALAVGDETWAAGDILFAHPTVDGKLTNVRPQHDLAVAFITVRHASTGQIAIRIIPGNNHLEWMHDVSITSPTAGQVLTYNGTLWANASASGVDTINDLGDVVITSPTDGQVLKYNTATSLWTNASAGGGASITVSDTPPVSPTAGALWFESDSGLTFIYYDSQWIEIGAGASYDPITRIVQAKGDLILGTASQTVDRLTVGTNSQRLIANSSAATGVSWASDSTNTVIDAKGDLLVGATSDVVARLPVGTDTQIMVANSGATNGLSWVDQPSSFRNVLINGGMDVWQRGSGGVALSNGVIATAFLADRWCSYRPASGSTQSRVAAGLEGFQYALRMQRDSGNTSVAALYMNQSIETSTMMKLANKQVTLSFYARAGANYSASGSLFGARVVAGTGTDINIIYTGVTGGTEPVSTTPVLTTSWQRFTATGIIPAGTTAGGVYFFFTPTGTASTNDYVDITGIQLEASTLVTPFEQRPIGVELALCQRYCLSYVNLAMGYTRNSIDVYSPLCDYPTVMRTAPTLRSGATFTVSTGSAGAVTLASETTLNRAWLYNGSNNWSTGAIVKVTAILEAEL